MSQLDHDRELVYQEFDGVSRMSFTDGQTTSANPDPSFRVFNNPDTKSA